MNHQRGILCFLIFPEIATTGAQGPPCQPRLPNIDVLLVLSESKKSATMFFVGRE